MKSMVRIATRKSPLALWQANYVKAELEKYYPGYDFTSDQQIIITLRLIKRGGLKLNL